MILSRSVSAAPLNIATNAQKFSALSPLTEYGIIWQQAPVRRPVTRHVLVSRVPQEALTKSLRVELDTLSTLVPGLGPGWAMKALMPAVMTAMSVRTSEAGVEGDAMVWSRVWCSPEATKLCAVVIAASRRRFCIAVMMDSATSVSSRVMAAEYRAVGLGVGSAAPDG